jgi:hypothetical protein
MRDAMPRGGMMTAVRRIPPEDAGRTPHPQLVVLDAGGRAVTTDGPYPWCTVFDPTFFLGVGLGTRCHTSHWEIVLGDRQDRTVAYLALAYADVQRTLVFSLARHAQVLHAIWLEQRLAICSWHGCPAVLVSGIPRSGLETLLEHAILLEASAAVTPN